MKTLYLGADHAGFKIKEELKVAFPEAIDLGGQNFVEDDDYPAVANALAKAVAENPGAMGILSCGNGVGVCMVANKTAGIRAGIGFSIEAARTMRTDDDANVLCLPGRIAIMDGATEIAKTFLQTAFSNEERHIRRLRQLPDMTTP